jgi:hypothetical protein
LIDENEVSKIKDMWLELRKNNEDVFRIDVKGISNYTFTDLDFGDDY